MITISNYRQSTAAFGLGVQARSVAGPEPKPGFRKADSSGQSPAVVLSRASSKESTTLTLYGPTGMTLDGLFSSARLPAAEQKELAKAHQAAQDLGQKKAEADAEVDDLSRKVAEHTKKLAAEHINALKEAARKARLLGLLDPKGAVAVAKEYSRQMAHSAREFGSANESLTELEDKQLTRLQPDEETTITREVSVEVSRAEVRTDKNGLRQAAIDAVTEAVGGLDDEVLLTGPSEADEATAPQDQADTGAKPDEPEVAANAVQVTDDREIEVSATAMQVTEDISITTVVDTTEVDKEAAAIMEGRLDRLEGDAEVIKDAILTLRELKTMMVVAAKEATKRGAIDKEFRKEFTEAKAEFTDAIVAVAEAAMPVIEAGFSIDPDEEA